MEATPDRIGRLPEITALTGLSRSSVYARVTENLLPHPVSLGGRAVGWPLREIAAVNAARIAGKSDDEIRALVIQLESDRRKE